MIKPQGAQRGAKHQGDRPKISYSIIFLVSGVVLDIARYAVGFGTLSTLTMKTNVVRWYDFQIGRPPTTICDTD